MVWSCPGRVPGSCISLAAEMDRTASAAIQREPKGGWKAHKNGGAVTCESRTRH